MEQNPVTPAMNQAIFKMKLGVEATSLYLLCCGIADTGERLVYKDILAVWNGSQESLQNSLGVLAELNILTIHSAPEKEEETYTLNPAEQWKEDFYSSLQS